jgi:hypothetical protein
MNLLSKVSDTLEQDSFTTRNCTLMRTTYEAFSHLAANTDDAYSSHRLRKLLWRRYLDARNNNFDGFGSVRVALPNSIVSVTMWHTSPMNGFLNVPVNAV